MWEAVMRRLSLETKYFKTRRSSGFFKAYEKLKNYYSRLYKKRKEEFFRNLNWSFVTDSKNFWKVGNPLFTEKGCVGGNNIVLLRKSKFINDDKKVSEALNSFFDDIVTKLDIRENAYNTEKIPVDMEPIKLL